jgi:hypothetical protein
MGTQDSQGKINLHLRIFHDPSDLPSSAFLRSTITRTMDTTCASCSNPLSSTNDPRGFEALGFQPNERPCKHARAPHLPRIMPRLQDRTPRSAGHARPIRMLSDDARSPSRLFQTRIEPLQMLITCIPSLC